MISYSSNLRTTTAAAVAMPMFAPVAPSVVQQDIARPFAGGVRLE